MPQSLSKIYLHIVFSTKHRHPFITDEYAEEIYKYLGGACEGQDCQPITVGGHLDHVHIMCMLARTITVADLVGDIKRESSKWVKTLDPSMQEFYWQDGYAVYSVSKGLVPRAEHYIHHQKDHHTKRSFQDESRIFFKRYEIEYDERYVWD